MKEEYLLTNTLESTNEPYAIAKIAGIKLCQAYRRQYGCNFISAMPTNLYGPNDNFDLESSHVLPALIRKFHLAKLAAHGDWDNLHKDEALFGPIPEDLKKPSGSNTSVVIWGSGSPCREFLHVDDLADACLFLMRNYDNDLHINVGTGKDITIRELADLVKSIISPDANLIFDTTKPDGTPQKLLDVSRLHQMGWKPKIKFRKGIKNVYKWYQSLGSEG